MSSRTSMLKAPIKTPLQLGLAESYACFSAIGPMIGNMKREP